MTKRIVFAVLFLIYSILCHAPYFVGALNQVYPKFIGVPLTVWFPFLLVVACCYLLYWASRNIVDGYEEEQK